MVAVYRTGVDRHLVTTADFPQQLPCTQPDIPNQKRVPIFRDPYDMIFAIPYRMTARFRREFPLSDSMITLCSEDLLT